MLTTKLYTAMKDGPALNVKGQLAAGEHRWNVSVFLQQRGDGRWRLGRLDDSETYILNHVLASIPARHGPNRTASNRDRRSLLNQIYQWVDKQYGFEPEALSTNNSATAPKENQAMSQCAIVSKYGLGPRCSKSAVEGDPRGRCKLHIHLESICGQLPTEAGDFRPEKLKKVAKVADKVTTAVTEALAETMAPAPMIPDGMIARGTLAAVDFTEPAPVEPSTPAKTKKARKRAKKAGASRPTR